MRRPLLVTLMFLATLLAGCSDGPETREETDTTVADDPPEDAVLDTNTSTEATDPEPEPTDPPETDPDPTAEPEADPAPEPPQAAPPVDPGMPTILHDALDTHVHRFSLDWDATPSEVHWWFGDGASATGPEVTHQYGRVDTYDVVVVARSGEYEGEDTHEVTVGDVPLTVHAARDGAVVAFSFDWGHDASSIAWDFGDGTTSTDASPTHRYETGGPFDVTLDVAGGGTTATQTHHIAFDDFPLTVSHERDRTLVTFAVHWGWDIEAIEWDFGDGQQLVWGGDGAPTEALLAPEHEYPDGGTQVVKVRVEGEGHVQSTLTSIAVPRYAPRILLDQDLEDITLSYEWDLEATQVTWDLGDDTTADTASVSHSYADLGHYDVRLDVTDGVVTRTVSLAVDVTNMHLDVHIVPGLPGNVFQASYTWLPDVEGTTTTWDYGDGTTSNDRDAGHAFASEGAFTVTLQVRNGAVESSWTSEPITVSVAPEPHVIVGIPDTGINPYHEMYYRPERTFPPSSFIPDFPDIEALPLSVGPGHGTFAQRLAADAEVWAAVEEDTWYWIPQTVFIAVHCEEPYVEPDNPATAVDESTLDVCILDDSHMHGTGTTSSALMENPDALIAFSESRGNVQQFVDAGIPVDIYSVSWGSAIRVAGIGGAYPYPAALCESPRPQGSLYVKSSGNEPGLSTTMDCFAGHPDIISVGGGYAEDQTQEPLAYKEADVVSYFCRPTAQTRVADDTLRDSACGTSFSAPTVAGALSKVVLGLRQESGHTGNMVGDLIDGGTVSLHDVRAAMEQTATYDPDSQYPNSGLIIPVNPIAPYTQWGWGFYDGQVADATLTRLLDGDTISTKSDEAQLYLETIHAIKWAYYGGDIEPALTVLAMVQTMVAGGVQAIVDQLVALLDELEP